LGELLAGVLVEPVSLLVDLCELSLDDLVHWVLEAVSWRQSLKTLVTAVILKCRLPIVAYCGLLEVEVGVREDDLLTLVTPGWPLPCEVLEGRQDVTCVMVDNKFGAHLLRHEFLWRRDPRG